MLFTLWLRYVVTLTRSVANLLLVASSNYHCCDDSTRGASTWPDSSVTASLDSERCDDSFGKNAVWLLTARLYLVYSYTLYNATRNAQYHCASQSNSGYFDSAWWPQEPSTASANTPRALDPRTHYPLYGSPLTLVAERTRCARNTTKDVVTILWTTLR